MVHIQLHFTVDGFCSYISKIVWLSSCELKSCNSHIWPVIMWPSFYTWTRLYFNGKSANISQWARWWNYNEDSKTVFSVSMKPGTPTNMTVTVYAKRQAVSQSWGCKIKYCPYKQSELKQYQKTVKSRPLPLDHLLMVLFSWWEAVEEVPKTQGWRRSLVHQFPQLLRGAGYGSIFVHQKMMMPEMLCPPLYSGCAE